MDINIETAFIKAFFPKNRRERLLYELNSPKHRSECLLNLQHTADSACKTHFEYPVFMEETLDLLRSLGAPATAYILSRNEEYDGRTLRLKDIYRDAELAKYLTGMICIPDKLAILSCEDTGSILLSRNLTK